MDFAALSSACEGRGGRRGQCMFVYVRLYACAARFLHFMTHVFRFVLKGSCECLCLYVCILCAFFAIINSCMCFCGQADDEDEEDDEDEDDDEDEESSPDEGSNSATEKKTPPAKGTATL